MRFAINPLQLYAGNDGTFARTTAEAYYARRGGPGWRVIGYDAAPKRGSDASNEHPHPHATLFSQMPTTVDVLVVGAGAGGGTAAMVAAEAGASVLLIDRGRFLSYGARSRATTYATSGF